MEMTIKAQELKKAYMKKWRDDHKAQLKAYYKEWKLANKDKVVAADMRYWNKLAAEE